MKLGGLTIRDEAVERGRERDSIVSTCASLELRISTSVVAVENRLHASDPLLPGGTRCRSTGHGDRSGRPHWDSNAEKTHRAERFRFNYEDDVGRENEVGGGLGFREGAKKRVWWSDEDMDDDDDRGGFGGLEEALDTSWILKAPVNQ
ncbi:hypothetical protein RHSIM_Rhsim09G0133200 [Rhododendron simsii]|uniref:Uncharacterized protein n=1 Tax=Rhododendron simsii TaxID=118357 RepID=A0A834GH13_RHOSS|nr:hypothetical protein RHSIM_Rhsim09G0133200 [Rhododendron simsii]